MPASTSKGEDYQKIFHWAETQKDGTIPSFAVRKNDPYEVCEEILFPSPTLTMPQYQAGFGNQ